MIAPTAVTPHRAARALIHVLATLVLCAALVTAAVLVPAPVAVLPVLVLVCIGLPMAVAHELPACVHLVRPRRPGGLRRRHLSRLRRQLDRLPETRHPLDL